MSPSAARSSFAIDVPDSPLARLRGGERAAFEQVYRWFERPVFNLALRVCGEREQAADVLQDTMLKVFHRIGDFRGTSGGARHEGGDASPFWGWLRQIAVNEALMSLRRSRRHDDVLPLPDGRDAVGDAATELIDDLTPPPPAAADAAALQRALDRLPAVTRSVLWLYHAEGYTHEEIASLMARTPSFSKSQLSRGTKRLRELLEPADGRAPTATTREAAHG
jgi:RNA polymerase sigma-70 factor (ECF subfamily)